MAHKVEKMVFWPNTNGITDEKKIDFKEKMSKIIKNIDYQNF